MRPALHLVLLLALAPVTGWGQAEEPDPWYQVELIIFANRDPEAAAAEAWPLLPTLDYPERWQGFSTGAYRELATDTAQLQLIEDTVPGLYELFMDRSIEELYADFERKRWLRVPRVELEPLVDFDVPRAMVKLPAELRTLNTQRRRIGNSAGLDVLFHESWLQRIRDRERSLPIIIDTPDRFGDFPELQGSVLIYSSRYLHVATNLWLNTNGAYLDSLAANWRMPHPPLPVDQSESPFVPFRIDPEPTWLDGMEDSMADELAADAGTVPDGAIVAMFPDSSTEPENSARTPDTLDEDGADDQPLGADLPAPASEAEVEAFLAEPVVNWDFRHAILVQQQRRMRSGELHYIDHPMLGVVIRVNRYEFQPFVTPPDDPGGLPGGP